MRSVSEMDRRDALRMMLGGVILASAGASLWPQDATALPEVTPADQPAPSRGEGADRTYAQTVRPLPAPAHRPPHRPPHRPRPPVHRRRRRWVCWWHRGRRHCGWRWR
ncbi:hypothetical protein JJE66_33345 [Bradyrhizobium diazoefficiens]|uniref:hypothetical protein n=1 Tax=Bradyrhizobium diazoefficiens TaxID=1355477 RepID=UPI0019095A1E|nr:hypothetical protein [Bradyrhizobium diazoefficiens]MBK3666094.1 hypothetical protein [Bradyrhizobium diazoefficiens]